jgi:hypothetical protein
VTHESHRPLGSKGCLLVRNLTPKIIFDRERRPMPTPPISNPMLDDLEAKVTTDTESLVTIPVSTARALIARIGVVDDGRVSVVVDHLDDLAFLAKEYDRKVIALTASEVLHLCRKARAVDLEERSVAPAATSTDDRPRFVCRAKGHTSTHYPDGRKAS